MAKELINGFGINDYDGPVKTNGKHRKFYQVWKSMIHRCYSEKFQKMNQTYIGCTICENWKSLENFKKWFDENYVEGWALDKDLLVENNKVYSPSSCVFLPPEINSFLTNHQRDRGSLPTGIYWDAHRQSYKAQIRLAGKTKHLGYYSSPKEAFQAYKEAKENRAKILAEKYKKELAKKAYYALMKYKEFM